MTLDDEINALHEKLAPSASTAPAPQSATPSPLDDEIEKLHTKLAVDVPPAADTTTAAPRDTIAPNLRKVITPDPGYVYGQVLPAKRDVKTGQLSVAVPSAVTQFANGILDLAEGPTTGTVTPEGTAALTVLTPGLASRAAAAGAKSPLEMATQAPLEDTIRNRAYQLWESEGRPVGRDEEFWNRARGETDAKTNLPDENSTSPATNKFVDAMHSHIANAAANTLGGGLGATVGGTLGGPVGAGVGMFLGASGSYLTKELIARYGPKVANAVMDNISGRIANLGTTNGALGAAAVNPLYSGREVAVPPQVPSQGYLAPDGSYVPPQAIPPAGPVYLRQQQKDGKYVPIA